MANKRRNKNKKLEAGDDHHDKKNMAGDGSHEHDGRRAHRCWDFILYPLTFIFRSNLRRGCFRAALCACIFVFLVLLFVYKFPSTHFDEFTTSEENDEFPVQDDGISAEIYRSPETIKRDYVDMNVGFRVFVYLDGLKGSVCNYPSKLGEKYAIEWYFFQNIWEMFSTDDPEKAHMFFIPIFCHDVPKQGRCQEDMTRTVQNFVHWVITKYPYWNRTLGADHFFVTCHEPGITATENVMHLVNNSIRLICSSSHDFKYRPHKDISVPQIFEPLAFPAAGNDVKNRTILGFWAGHRSSKLRDVLINTWQNDKELDIHDIQNYIIDKSTKIRLLYQEKFFRSKFCICPYGPNDHGGNLPTAIHYGCVPVILSDNYNLPFNDILDWRKFSVLLKEKDVYHLKNILKRIPDATYKQLQENTIQVQKHFAWYSPPYTLDVFHMMMYELWLRRRGFGY